MSQAIGIASMDQAQLDRCLTDAEFEQLHSGELTPQEESPLQDHLGTCSRCWTRYEELLGDDPLFKDLKEAWDDRATVVGFGSGAKTESASGPRRRAPGGDLAIEGYEIIDELGRGGMGVVYEAIQTKLNRRVALKVLPSGQGYVSREAVSRFKREATAAARLHHTNIVPVYDFGESKHTYYYAMELIEGEPLTRVIRRLAAGDDPSIMQAHSIAATMHSQVSQVSMMGQHAARGHYHQIARWMADAADALHYAHSQGIIHRDIKPGNMIMANDGRIMILDFGLAKSVDDISMTRTGTMIGTLRYMSPEQVLAKEKKLDHRTDIYSLGAALYELLTFQAAFKGRDQKELLSQILNREPTPPRKILPEIPRELDTICLKTLEKEPGARYDTAKALARDLRRFTQDLPIVARPVGPVGRTVKFVRRRPWLSLASAASLLLVVAVVVSVLVGRFAHERNLEAFHQEANRLIRQGEYADAIDTLNKLLAIAPNHTRGLINMAIARKNLFNYTGEQELLIESLEHSQRAIDILEQAILSPDADEISSSTELTPKGLLIHALNIKGIVHKKLRDFDLAAAAYRRGLEVDPGHSVCWENLGVVFALQGELEQARKTLEKAAEIAGQNPDFVGAWRNFGAVQMELGDARSQHSLIRATRIKPDDPGPWLLLARMFLTLNEPETARDHALVSKTQDDDNDPRDPRVKRYFALAELRRDRPDVARGLASDALELGGHKAFNHLILSIAHARLDDFEKARIHFDLALSDWPGELEEKGVIATHDGSLLWFEHFDELAALHREAQELLTHSRP